MFLFPYYWGLYIEFTDLLEYKTEMEKNEIYRRCDEMLRVNIFTFFQFFLSIVLLSLQYSAVCKTFGFLFCCFGVVFFDEFGTGLGF